MQVQRITDRAEIRRRLNTDRNWSLYALADLDPGMFELSEWWSAGDGLALVFSGIAIRPIFIMGKAEEARARISQVVEGQIVVGHTIDACVRIVG